MRQRRIGGVSAVPIFDVIEQLGDVAALKLDEAAVAYVRQNIFLEHPLDLAGGAQAAFVDVAFEPCFGHGLDAVGFGWRRLEGCQALLDAADDAAGDVPGFGDLHRVGRAYLHPALPFVKAPGPLGRTRTPCPTSSAHVNSGAANICPVFGGFSAPDKGKLCAGVSRRAAHKTDVE